MDTDSRDRDPESDSEAPLAERRRSGEVAHRRRLLRLFAASALLIGAVLAAGIAIDGHRRLLLVGAGALLVASVAIFADATGSSSRRRRVVVATVAATVVVGSMLGGLAWHASRNGTHGDFVASFPTSFGGGAEIDDTVIGLYDRLTVFTLDLTDGEISDPVEVGLSPVAFGRGPVAVAGSLDGDLMVVDVDGAVRWEHPFAVAGEEADPTVPAEVVAADAEGRTVVLACADFKKRRCEFVGVDPDGEERWRTPTDGRVAATPATSNWFSAVRRIPSTLVVVDESPDRNADRAISVVSISTGESRYLTDGRAAFPASGLIGVVRAAEEGCELAVFVDDELDRSIAIPCSDTADSTFLNETSVTFLTTTPGSSATNLSTTAVVVDIDPVGADDSVGTVTTEGTALVTGAGTIVEHGDDGLSLIRVADAEDLVSFGSEWYLIGVGPEALVLHDPVDARNPLLSPNHGDVQVVDPTTGETCAAARLPPSVTLVWAIPLRGCRALVSTDDTSYLIG